MEDIAQVEYLRKYLSHQKMRLKVNRKCNNLNNAENEILHFFGIIIYLDYNILPIISLKLNLLNHLLNHRI